MDKNKRRPVFEPEPPPDEDLIKLEKNITSIRDIRKNRLNRIEAEYSKKKQELELSRQMLEKRDQEVNSARQAFVDGKESLRNHYLNRASSLNSLREWSEKEESLKKDVGSAVLAKEESADIVEENKKKVDEAKKEYQKVLLSIEKLDVFLEEIQENA